MAPPTLHFGTANVGVVWTIPEEVEKLANELAEAQITTIDTAARYPPTNMGESERLLGAAKIGEGPFLLNTKILIVVGKTEGSMSLLAAQRSVEQSLESLRVKKVNVLYSHAPDFKTPLSEQVETIRELHSQDLFNHFGVSLWPQHMLEGYIKATEASNQPGIKPTYYQNRYNVLDRCAETEIMPYLRQQGINFVAFSPLASGFLTGKLTFNTGPESLKGTRFEETETNLFGKAARHAFDRPGMHAAVRKLDKLCKEYNIPMEAAAIRWLAFHSALKEGDAILIGASKLEQVHNSANAIVEGALPEKLATEMDSLFELTKEDAEATSSYK